MDIENREMRWSLNGKWFPPTFLNFSFVGGLRPSMCAQPTFTARFVFGGDAENAHKFSPPEQDYQPVVHLINSYVSTQDFELLSSLLLAREPGVRERAWMTRSGYTDTIIDMSEQTIVGSQNYPTVFLTQEPRTSGLLSWKVIVLDIPTVKQVCRLESPANTL